MYQKAVSLQHVSKIYKTYERPRDRLLEMIYRGKKVYHKSFSALTDVSFEVPRGTTFGILGRNGSGKSTVLQIIASVLQPTSGEVSVSGRISALLELGSGFNPEFTGLDNVYLYASILGLSRDEITERLPAILEFADIGNFVEQPIKTYSSGMVVRLAFSVAVSIEPDIFLVDEALAVGDALFQHKCMLRMRQIMKSGATVIFVSHDLATVKSLCEKAVLLERGKVVALGTAEEVAREYHQRLFSEEVTQSKPAMGSDFGAQRGKSHSENITICSDAKAIKAPNSPALTEFQRHAQTIRFGTGEALIEYVEVLDSSGNQSTTINYGERFLIRLHARCQTNITSLVAGFVLRNSRGVDIVTSNTHIEHVTIPSTAENEKIVVDFELENTLRDDHYSINVALTHEQYFHEARHFDWVDNALVFRSVKPKNSIVYGVFYPTDVGVQVWRNEIQEFSNDDSAPQPEALRYFGGNR